MTIIFSGLLVFAGGMCGAARFITWPGVGHPGTAPFNSAVHSKVVEGLGAVLRSGSQLNPNPFSLRLT